MTKPTATSSPPWGWGEIRDKKLIASVRMTGLEVLRAMEGIGVPALAPTGSPPKPKEPTAKGKAKTPIPFCKHLRSITGRRGPSGKTGG
jgi:hypothetical protein